jgi:hypothetical protein
MSNRGARMIVLLVATAIAAPNLSAQTIVEARARAAALTAQLRALEATRDSLRRAQDTIDVDGVRFVVKPGNRAQAEQAAHLALAELDSVLGPRDRHLLDGWVSSALLNGWADSAGPRRAVNDVVAAAGDRRLLSLGGLTLRRWGRWWQQDSDDLRGAFLSLVTSPSAAARNCLGGDTHACAAVLGLVPTGDRWLDLFDPAGRRVWVRSRFGWLPAARQPRYQRYAAEYQRCVAENVDAACLDVLHAYSLEAPLLLSTRCQLSVVAVARSLGGDGTLTRLVADTTAPVGDRLAAAATVPLDSLLRVWHERVVAARPPGTRVGLVAGWTSVLVVMMAGGLAMRSTRWRLD